MPRPLLAFVITHEEMRLTAGGIYQNGELCLYSETNSGLTGMEKLQSSPPPPQHTHKHKICIIGQYYANI